VTDLQELIDAVDELSPDALETLYRHILVRRQQSFWIVPSENLAAILDIMRPVHEAAKELSEEEINAEIDQALEEVRRERKSSTHRRD
jgi:hypothetical protein